MPWLRDRDDPATLAYLEAENAYYDAWFAERNDRGSTSVRGDQARGCRRPTSPRRCTTPAGGTCAAPRRAATTRSIAAAGQRRGGGRHVAARRERRGRGNRLLLGRRVRGQPRHELLAWSCDLDGSERYTLRVRDLTTGAERDDVSTTRPGRRRRGRRQRTLFYVTPDEQMRPYRVWRTARHDAGRRRARLRGDSTSGSSSCVGLSRSGEWIVIECGSKTSAEALLIPAVRRGRAPPLVRPRADDVEYSVDHWGDRFVVVTNLDAEDFRVMTRTARRARRRGPSSCRTSRAGGSPTSSRSPSHLVLHEWARRADPAADPVPRRRRRASSSSAPSRTTSTSAPTPSGRADASGSATSRFTTPATVYDEDVRTGERTLLKQTPVPERRPRRSYIADARVGDGARRHEGAGRRRAPRRHSRRRHARRACVYGYGTLRGARCRRGSAAARLSLLDRGVVWALVHPRGGGELGRRWYLDGKLLHKRNTFTDTIAVRRAPRRSTAGPRRERVAIRGGSAGGLLVGACVTMRPDLFAAAVAEVPFVDVVTTMSDPTLPLTVTEWEEWGDPRERAVGELHAELLAVRQHGGRPTTRRCYVTAGLNDPRVSYHEPAKWVAKLRAVRTNDAPLLLRAARWAPGTAARAAATTRWRDEARVLAFVLRTSVRRHWRANTRRARAAPTLRATVLRADRLRRPRAEACARRALAFRQALGDQRREQQQQEDRHDLRSRFGDLRDQRGADRQLDPWHEGHEEEGRAQPHGRIGHASRAASLDAPATTKAMPSNTEATTDTTSMPWSVSARRRTVSPSRAAITSSPEPPHWALALSTNWSIMSSPRVGSW